MCHRITCKGYERKECVHGGKDRFKEQYSILLPTLMYGSKTWTWNRTQQSRVCGVEMSYLRKPCGMVRWKDENNDWNEVQ